MVLLFERNIFGYVVIVFISFDFNLWVFFIKVIFYLELRLFVFLIFYNDDCFEFFWIIVNKRFWIIVNKRK